MHMACLLRRFGVCIIIVIMNILMNIIRITLSMSNGILITLIISHVLFSSVNIIRIALCIIVILRNNTSMVVMAYL